MNDRLVVRGSVRACALLALTGLLSTLAPAHVGRAQSAPPLTPWRGLVDHVSVNVYGQAPQASVDLAAKSLSADGRFVVMTSYAWDLTPDGNYYQSVFLRDRAKGTTRRVSLANDGSIPDGGSAAGSISADGRQIAFTSWAGNLVAGDTNWAWDVFVRDLNADRTVRVSVASDGGQADSNSFGPVISANGRFVAFVSEATNLSDAVLPYGVMQVYVQDRDADANGVFDEPGGVATSLVSRSPNGGYADAWTRNIRISADGRLVLFESQATNLVPGTTLDGTNHVYVYDRQLQQTALIDRAVTGGPSAWGVTFGSSDLSDDGRYVTYSSFSHDIVPLDMNWTAQAFRHDRASATGDATVIVSQHPDGTLGDADSDATAVSGDGRYVVLRTFASNLAAPAASEGAGSVIVRDMAEGTFTRVDVIGDDVAFDHWYPANISISSDGTAAAFNSDATNVVSLPYPNAQQAFVATALAASPTAASFPIEGGAGSIEVNTLPMTGWTAVSLDPWIVLMEGAGFDIGPRLVTYFVDSNPQGIVRDGRIQLGSMIVTIHQEGDGDQTPPVITPIVTGTQVNGWYTSDIALHWEISDPDSPFHITQGCDDVLFITDFMLATPSCVATSHGGTASASLSLRRDTTAPAISVAVPFTTTYPLQSAIAPNFSCSDGGGAGVASCTATTPMDTSTPGRKVFTVTATDLVGHSLARSVEYTVGTGVCVAPNANVKAWFRFEQDTADVYGASAGRVGSGPVFYNPGIAGAGLRGQGTYHLEAFDGTDRFRVGQQVTIAAWVASSGAATSSATIVASEGQYRLAVFPDSTLRWAFNVSSGFNWVNTGIVLTRRADVFTHVAVTYDAGLVLTYVDGRLAHSYQLDGVVFPAGNIHGITIGGRKDLYTPFYGTIDDLQIYSAALTPDEIDAIALAGDGSLCLPKPTALTLSAPPSVGYMGKATVGAQLLNGAGLPMVGQSVAIDTFLSPTGASTGRAVAYTDVNGNVSAVIQLAANAVPGSYPTGVRASFSGDAYNKPSQASAAASVVAGTPAVAWTPSAITYGTPLGLQQLNATANTSGTYSYDPPAGTVLNAGAQPLSVTFTPDDLTRWETVTTTTTLQVDKATPALRMFSTNRVYNGLPQVAEASASGVGSEPLTPVVVTYNGSTTPPAGAGAYALVATYNGSANYTAVSTTATMTIAPAPLTIAADSVSKPFGQPLPAFTSTISGLVSGETVLSLAGTLTYATAATPSSAVGSYRITPSGVSSPNYDVTFVDGTLTVVRAATVITAGVSPNPVGFGQPVTVTAAVTLAAPGLGTPTGSVQFFDGTTLLGTVALTGGPVSLTTAGLPAGTHTLNATYSGDGSFTGNSSAAAFTVATAAASSSVVVSSSPNPSNPGQTVTFTAAVTAPPGTIAGSVDFYDGATFLGSAPIAGSSASFRTSALGTGGHAITARFSGNANVPPSVSPAFAHTVQASGTKPRATTTTVTASPSTGSLGGEVALTATVTGSQNRVPTGLVVFLANGTVVGSAALSATGNVTSAATLRISTLPHGAHAIGAVYLADSAFRSSSGAAKVTVN